MRGRALSTSVCRRQRCSRSPAAAGKYVPVRPPAQNGRSHLYIQHQCAGARDARTPRPWPGRLRFRQAQTRTGLTKSSDEIKPCPRAGFCFSGHREERHVEQRLLRSIRSPIMPTGPARFRLTVAIKSYAGASARRRRWSAAAASNLGKPRPRDAGREAGVPGRPTLRWRAGRGFPAPGRS